MGISDVQVVLLVPARNESEVISPTLEIMLEAVQRGVVSQAVVLNSGSTDDTAQVVREAGVACMEPGDIRSDVGVLRGKGDALWRGINAYPSDVYVFLDADLGRISVDHIDALVKPLLTDSNVMFVKSGFVRVDENGEPRDKAAGRVTEEVGRPLAAREHPRLAELSQPLSGQVAIRASALRNMSIVTGYGIEIAMLIDMWRQFGEKGLQEIEWGPLHNRWKPDDALTEVRDHVLAGATLRGVTLPQFGDVVDDQVVDRPPIGRL
jgi:glucosyl-3-phosphoglycerate synthase